MLGAATRYSSMHSFRSDQYEHKLEYVGHATAWDEFVMRGSLAEGKLIGFYLREGLVQAAAGLDRGGDPEVGTDRAMAPAAQLVGARARRAPRMAAHAPHDL